MFLYDHQWFVKDIPCLKQIRTFIPPPDSSSRNVSVIKLVPSPCETFIIVVLESNIILLFETSERSLSLVHQVDLNEHETKKLKFGEIFATCWDPQSDNFFLLTSNGILVSLSTTMAKSHPMASSFGSTLSMFGAVDFMIPKVLFSIPSPCSPLQSLQYLSCDHCDRIFFATTSTLYSLVITTDMGLNGKSSGKRRTINLSSKENVLVQKIFSCPISCNTQNETPSTQEPFYNDSSSNRGVEEEIKEGDYNGDSSDDYCELMYEDSSLHSLSSFIIMRLTHSSSNKEQLITLLCGSNRLFIGPLSDLETGLKLMTPRDDEMRLVQNMDFSHLQRIDGNMFIGLNTGKEQPQENQHLLEEKNEQRKSSHASLLYILGKGKFLFKENIFCDLEDSFDFFLNPTSTTLSILNKKSIKSQYPSLSFASLTNFDMECGDIPAISNGYELIPVVIRCQRWLRKILLLKSLLSQGTDGYSYPLDFPLDEGGISSRKRFKDRRRDENRVNRRCLVNIEAPISNENLGSEKDPPNTYKVKSNMLSNVTLHLLTAPNIMIIVRSIDYQSRSDDMRLIQEGDVLLQVDGIWCMDMNFKDLIQLVSSLTPTEEGREQIESKYGHVEEKNEDVKELLLGYGDVFLPLSSQTVEDNLVSLSLYHVHNFNQMNDQKNELLDSFEEENFDESLFGDFMISQQIVQHIIDSNQIDGGVLDNEKFIATFDEEEKTINLDELLLNDIERANIKENAHLSNLANFAKETLEWKRMDLICWYVPFSLEGDFQRCIPLCLSTPDYLFVHLLDENKDDEEEIVEEDFMVLGKHKFLEREFCQLTYLFDEFSNGLEIGLFSQSPTISPSSSSNEQSSNINSSDSSSIDDGRDIMIQTFIQPMSSKLQFVSKDEGILTPIEENLQVDPTFFLYLHDRLTSNHTKTLNIKLISQNISGDQTDDSSESHSPPKNILQSGFDFILSLTPIDKTNFDFDKEEPFILSQTNDDEFDGNGQVNSSTISFALLVIDIDLVVKTMKKHGTFDSTHYPYMFQNLLHETCFSSKISHIPSLLNLCDLMRGEDEAGIHHIFDISQLEFPRCYSLKTGMNQFLVSYQSITYNPRYIPPLKFSMYDEENLTIWCSDEKRDELLNIEFRDPFELHSFMMKCIFKEDHESLNGIINVICEKLHQIEQTPNKESQENCDDQEKNKERSSFQNSDRDSMDSSEMKEEEDEEEETIGYFPIFDQVDVVYLKSVTSVSALSKLPSNTLITKDQKLLPFYLLYHIWKSVRFGVQGNVAKFTSSTSFYNTIRVSTTLFPVLLPHHLVSLWPKTEREGDSKGGLSTIKFQFVKEYFIVMVQLHPQYIFQEDGIISYLVRTMFFEDDDYQKTIPQQLHPKIFDLIDNLVQFVRTIPTIEIRKYFYLQLVSGEILSSQNGLTSLIKFGMDIQKCLLMDIFKEISIRGSNDNVEVVLNEIKTSSINLLIFNLELDLPFMKDILEICFCIQLILDKECPEQIYYHILMSFSSLEEYFESFQEFKDKIYFLLLLISSNSKTDFNSIFLSNIQYISDMNYHKLEPSPTIFTKYYTLIEKS